MGKADEIVNCGDAGQEGELIQRWVMLKAGGKMSCQETVDFISDRVHKGGIPESEAGVGFRQTL